MAYEPVPQATRSLKDRIVENMPQEIPFTGDKGIKLQDVADGLASMEDFVAQLTPEDLEALSHGDYIMGALWAPWGNAGVLGGITESLRALGVPPATTTDGPSASGCSTTAPCCPAVRPWPALGTPSWWRASTRPTAVRW